MSCQLETNEVASAARYQSFLLYSFCDDVVGAADTVQDLPHAVRDIATVFEAEPLEIATYNWTLRVTIVYSVQHDPIIEGADFDMAFARGQDGLNNPPTDVALIDSLPWAYGNSPSSSSAVNSFPLVRCLLPGPFFGFIGT